MGRKKVLTKRVYTFEQLTARWTRWRKRAVRAAAGTWVSCDCPLRGGMVVTGHYLKSCLILQYVSKQFSFELARVYRASGGDTVYEVFGVGHAAATAHAISKNHREKQMAFWRKAWRRYAPMFTPVVPATTLGAIAVYYRLHDGVATPCGRVDNTGPDSQGVWLSRTAVYSSPTPAEWAAAYPAYPNFPRRAAVFYTRLRKEVVDAGIGEAKPMRGDLVNWYSSQPGIVFEVCSPPSRHRNGRRLLVTMAMYDKDGRQFHHVDGDYAPQHSQFFALEDGKSRAETVRWKCAADALVGIKEWIIGDIYIPGPG
jgi:hypothetical protein